MKPTVTLHVCTVADLLATLGGFALVEESQSWGVLIDRRKARVIELAKAGWSRPAIHDQVNSEFTTLKPLRGSAASVILSRAGERTGVKPGLDICPERPVVKRLPKPLPLPVAAVSPGSTIAPPTRQQLMAGR